MKTEANASEKTERTRLKMSVCAWDWLIGARVGGLINSLHKAPAVNVA